MLESANASVPPPVPSHNQQIIGVVIAGFNVLLCHVGIFTYANFHLAAPPFSLSISAQGSLFLVYGLGIFITPMSGKIIDRLGHRTGICIAVAIVITGALLMLLPSLPLFILGIALSSSGIFVAQATASSHIGIVAHGARSAASGLYVACYYLGGSFGATALVLPWKAGGWPAIILSVIVVQCLLLYIAWRSFNAIGHQAKPLDGLAGLE